MSHGILESDWRRFRRVREFALERLCERILAEVSAAISESNRSHHERYREVFRLIRDGDADIAGAFDGPKRSAMLQQLSAIHSLGLLEANELLEFSAETRETVEALAGLHR